MAKLKYLKILLVLVFITSYELLVTSYEVFAQEKIVAIVNREIITQKDLSDFISFMRMQLSRQYRGRELENKIQSMKLDLLDKLIEDCLILQEAKNSNIQIDPNRIKARIEEIKRHSGSEMEFQDALRKQGLVEADIEARIKEQALMYSIIEEKVKSKVVIDPQEVTDFYQKNPQEFILPEEREFESIAVSSEQLAKEVVEHLRADRSLQDLSQKYSLKVSRFSSRKGGELKKEIENAVFRLRLSAISEPIKIGDTCYIFKLVKINPARQQNLSEAGEVIRGFLFEQKFQEELTRWLDALKKKSYIKIM